MAESGKLKTVEEFERDLKYAHEILCRRIPAGEMNNAVVYLLSAMLLKLSELTAVQTIGSRSFNITPYVLGTSPTRILDTDFLQRTRRVTLWFDSAVGGPFPTIRVGTNVANANAGGVLVQPGTFAEMGLIPFNTKLYAASSRTITVYVVEHA